MFTWLISWHLDDTIYYFCLVLFCFYFILPLNTFIDIEAIYNTRVADYVVRFVNVITCRIFSLHKLLLWLLTWIISLPMKDILLLYYWFNEFKKGCPKSNVVPEETEAVRKLIMQNKHVIYLEIQVIMSVSMTNISIIWNLICINILSKNMFGARNLSRIWCIKNHLQYI